MLGLVAGLCRLFLRLLGLVALGHRGLLGCLRPVALGHRRLLRSAGFLFGSARLLPLPGGRSDARSQGQQDQGTCCHTDTVTPHELGEAIARARRSRLHRFISQVPTEIGGQLLHRRVAPGAVLLQGLHGDPVEVTIETLAQHIEIQTPQGGDLLCVFDGGRLGARPRWFLLADDALDFAQARLHQAARMEGRLAAEQFIEKDAERIDIAASIDVDATHLGLLGTHVGRCADQHAARSKDGLVGQAATGGLGDAEVDDLGLRFTFGHADQDVGRLEVAVDDTLLMGVLYGLADLGEEIDAGAQTQAMDIAVVGDGHAVDVFHGEPRAPRLADAGIEDLGDTRVLHQGKCLPLDLEARQDLATVHAWLEQLERDTAAHRFFLLGQEDLGEAALAQRLAQGVGTDLAAHHLCDLVTVDTLLEEL